MRTKKSELEPDYTLLGEQALVTVDTNVVRDLFRGPKQHRDEWLRVLGALEDRLFLTDWVARELITAEPHLFNETRTAAKELEKTLTAFEKKVVDAVKAATKRFGEVQGEVPLLGDFVEVEEPLGTVAQAAQEAVATLKGQLQEAQETTDKDAIKRLIAQVDDLFDGKVLRGFKTDKLIRLSEEARTRFESRMAPGYLDADKDGNNPYGDFIIWKEFIRHAKQTGKPIVFITRDSKEDWWAKAGRKTLGPRPELLKEFQEQTGQTFYAYKPDQFLEQLEAFNIPEEKDTTKKVAEAEQKRAAARQSVTIPATLGLGETARSRLVADIANIYLPVSEVFRGMQSTYERNVMDALEGATITVSELASASPMSGLTLKSPMSGLTLKSPVSGLTLKSPIENITAPMAGIGKTLGALRPETTEDQANEDEW